MIQNDVIMPGFVWKAALFQLLIKSMSKIQNHINEKNFSQSQHSPNNHSCPEVIQHQKIPGNILSSQYAPHKFQQQSDHMHNKQQPFQTKIDELQLRFSRFKPWNLIQSAENLKVDRESEENRATAEKNIQQSNQLISQSDYQFGTPIKVDPIKYSDQKANFQSYSCKKQSLITSMADKKIRPKQKGLRKLSEKAFNIVKQLGQTTYKQVAIKLIQQIQEEEPELNQQKQENNIKRRVYDALNVLIAMKFLKKKGRNIVYEADSEAARQQNIYLAFKQQKNQKIHQLLMKSQKLKQKKQEMRRMKIKMQVLKALLNRNKIQGKNHTDRISFPFVCLVVGVDSLGRMKISNPANHFSLTTLTKQYSFFGDVDFLLKHPNLV